MQSYVVYSSMVIIPLLLSILANKVTIKQCPHLFIWLIIIFLSVICGFRSIEVGLDSAGYARNFLVQDLGWYEIGFTLLQVFLYGIWPNYTFFFTVVGLLTNILFIFRLYDFNKRGALFPWCVLLFTMTSYSVSFNGMRQWLAVSICFFATRYLYNDKKPKLLLFMIFVFFATIMHNSAIVSLVFLLPIVFGHYKGVGAQVAKIISVIIFIVAFFLGNTLMAERRYFRLLYSDSFSLGYMVFLKTIVIIFALINNKIDKNDEMDLKFYGGRIVLPYFTLVVMECIYVALSSLSYWFNVIGRIAWYFEVFETVFFCSSVFI